MYIYITYIIYIYIYIYIYIHICNTLENSVENSTGGVLELIVNKNPDLKSKLRALQL